MHLIDRSRRNLAIAAAGLAGFVDAIGFLSADRYFVSFMSGNTTRLGVDLATSPAEAPLPALLIAGFVVGVFGGALLAARSGPRRKPTVLALVAGLLVSAALANEVQAVKATLGLLVLAMGALNNTFQRDGEVTVGLTYMTGALVRLGQGLAARLTGVGNREWRGWLALWLGLALGAVSGAYTLTTWPALAFWIAAGWAFGLTLWALRLLTEPGQQSPRRT